MNEDKDLSTVANLNPEPSKDMILSELKKLRDSFRNRYKSYEEQRDKYGMRYDIYKKLKIQAKAAKRSYLDLNKLCKRFGVVND